MFARIAPRYDRANRWLSMGVDQGWRRKAMAFCGVQAGERALDVCTGTGDVALALRKRGADVVGGDFCAEMVHLAGRKEPEGKWLVADTMALPFGDGAFDLATVAFGIRNVSDPVKGLREMGRVVRSGGRVLVLEFCKPRVPLVGGAYLFYFRNVLPRLGSWITGDRNGAYRYLPESVMAFPEREAFLSLMEQAGLVRPRMKILSLGIAALYLGEVP